MIKKFSVILLFLLLLTSCGKENFPDTGVYTCEQIIKNGEVLPAGEYFLSPPVLTLAEKNKAVLAINGVICDGIWENSGGELRVLTGDKLSSGTLENGVCTLDLFGQGILYSFSLDSFSLPQEKDEKKNNRWSGDWYGYWCIQNASGEWEDFDGQFFDCFAVINMSIDNTGEIKLWDEKSSLYEPLAVVQLKLAPSSTLYGTARSEFGFFLADDIEKGEWKIEPDQETPKNVLTFSSHYSDQNGEFDYMFLLRPWGYVWDDAEEGNIRLPYFYNQWYLPRLSGNFPMPDSFEP